MKFGNMSYSIIYHEEVVKDISKLDSAIKLQIKKAIELKLMEDPLLFGFPLRKSLNGYKKLRVGDYRIVFSIHEKTVKIFAIQHRSIVYKKIIGRV